MHAYLLLAAAGASLATAQNVLHLEISKPHLTFQQRRQHRLARRNTITEPLVNAGYLYVANISVGTPPQQLQVQVDTGSSDVWMTSAAASYCQQSETNCVGGTFDETSSSTFNLVDANGFEIQYVDETGSSGDFFTDVLMVGPLGSQTSINHQQMGLARQTTIGTGILGVGFAADESVCAQTGPTNCNTYPTLVEQMVAQRKINSKSYSLWLNDLDANTGSILFGGIDTKKYMGSLVTLPIQPDVTSGGITSFTVAWTDFSLGTSDGSVGGFVDSSFAEPAILDSGTTLILVPDDLAAKIYKQFGARYYSEGQTYLAPCSLRSSTATFDFQFGGASGALIRVPINELLLDTGTDEYGEQLTFSDGTPACEVGIEAAKGRPILFGDTFLRSAYVVYDLDNRQVSLAQTNFNATTSDVREIKAGRNGIPSVSVSATRATASQSATGVGGLFGDAKSGFQSTAVASFSGTSRVPSSLARPPRSAISGDSMTTPDPSVSVDPSSSMTGPPLAQYTAPNTNSPQPNGGAGNGAVTSDNSGGDTSQAAAPRSLPHGPIFLRIEGAWMAALLSAFVALGGTLVLM